MHSLRLNVQCLIRVAWGDKLIEFYSVLGLGVLFDEVVTSGMNYGELFYDFVIISMSRNCKSTAYYLREKNVIIVFLGK